MKAPDILQQRLHTQQISDQTFKKVGDVVKWMGAIQAQDFLYSLWAVGLRMENPEASEEIRKAISNGTILRTWPMRGTIHYVPAEDALWMIKLLSDRVIRSHKSVYRKAGVDAGVIKKSKKILAETLQGKQMTRKEIYKALGQSGVDATAKTPVGSRGSHIIRRIAMEGFICFGPHRGKQQTFVLLDEWVPNPRTIEGDEALAELAKRYFRSHGPATEYDFAWWTGLTVSDARSGIEIIKSQLGEETIGDNTYWFTEEMPASTAQKTIPEVFLLPFLDEYTVGYKDRDALVTSGVSEQIYSGNNQGILWPVIVIGGRVVGIWKRMLKKGSIEITTTLYKKVNKIESKALRNEAERYGRFFKKPVTLL